MHPPPREKILDAPMTCGGIVSDGINTVAFCPMAFLPVSFYPGPRLVRANTLKYWSQNLLPERFKNNFILGIGAELAVPRLQSSQHTLRSGRFPSTCRLMNDNWRSTADILSLARKRLDSVVCSRQVRIDQ